MKFFVIYPRNINTYSFLVLSLEEALSCIPPPARYPYDTRTSISSNRVADAWPSRITRWEEFLIEVNQYNFVEHEEFERPQFFKGVEVVVDSNVDTAMEISRSMGSSHYGSNVSSIFSGNQETWQQDNDETTEQDFDFSELRIF
ncbi:hypothetical protein C1646_739901 [Rhizophagus diaphanus]|nr:hypothetical protein C1646_739901 [Rhizophagus diaphanus] [Rhizophagus sp. MUCL 43196]